MPPHEKSVIAPVKFTVGASKRRVKSKTASWTRSLENANVGVSARLRDALNARHLPQVGPLLRQPGISRLNGSLRGRFEPGGQYEITGLGFGARDGKVFLRFAGQTLHLRIDHWSDTAIFAGLDDAISGCPDADAVDLIVGVEGGSALQSARFGFRAAREDVWVAPPLECFSYDKGTAFEVLGKTIWTAAAPRVANDSQFLTVTRSIYHDDPDVACYPVGIDRVRWNISVKPGFEVVHFDWQHEHLSNIDRDGTQYTYRGTYTAVWDGDDIRIEYGVQRIRKPPFVLLDGSVSCRSFYKIRLKLTGPRGMPPL